MTDSREFMQRESDGPQAADVIVIGYGFAGGAAAIAAADAGCSILLLEKMPIPGGISICSGGGLRVATDAGRALDYLRATNDGTVEDDLLRAFAAEITTLEARIGRLAAINGATLRVLERPGNYPLTDCRRAGGRAGGAGPTVDARCLTRIASASVRGPSADTLAGSARWTAEARVRSVNAAITAGVRCDRPTH